MGQTPHSMGLACADDLYRMYIKCLDKFKGGFTTSKQGKKFLQTQDGKYGCFIEGVHKMLGQIQWRVHQIKTRNKVPTNTGRNVWVCFIQGVQNRSGQIQQFSTTKQNKNFIQTQSEDECFFFLAELKDYIQQ
jgi:ribosomal protein S4E